MLELQGISRRFGDTVALDDVSFGVADGTLHGFVGRNGAGKTTTMRIILGVLEADAGEVRYAGEPVGRRQRSRFGYMPEERGLYPKMVVREQLRYFARLHGVPAARAAAASDELIERLGLQSRAGDAVETLSLGNQQRVQLAVALVHDPDFLVLDEPFSGLDPTGVDVLAEVLLERVRDGVGVLFSSHQLELVERLCDAVAIVEAGRLRAQGTVAQLRRHARGERWLLELADAPPDGWERRLPGTVVQLDGPRAVVELAGDGQAVLEAGRTLGAVRRFGPQEATLAEVFRDAVEEPVTA